MRTVACVVMLLASGSLQAIAIAGPVADPFAPRVIVGVADSGFNVYHEVYRRPDLVAHPCTYVRDFPCDLPALELTFDAPTWQEAFEADKEKWAAIKPGDAFWIPGTNIIAAICDATYTSKLGIPIGADLCILDDTSMHGTGTTSSVLSENPDALLVVAEGTGNSRSHFTSGRFPVDIISQSWGHRAPSPFTCGMSAACTPDVFEVVASGNEGAFPVVLDATKSHPNHINVGAADAGSRDEPGYSGWKTMDFVSEYCRPTADTKSFTGIRPSYCGTSFSAPTFAGALSRVVLETRQRSGWTGGMEEGVVDPILGITIADVREALNRTATYEPADRWDDTDERPGVPLVAPWYQWGWGYFDASRVDAALACLLDGDCPERPEETKFYMETLWTYRNARHHAPAQNDAGSGRDAPDSAKPKVWVQPEVLYEGAHAELDAVDHYAFAGRAGQFLQVRYEGVRGQLTVLDASGAPLDDRTPSATMAYYSTNYETTLPADGTYYIRLSAPQPQDYWFAFGLDQTAPSGVHTQPGLAQDDAGSGRDAPDLPSTAVAIRPGVRYQAAHRWPDGADHYAFEAVEGSTLHVRVQAPTGDLTLLHADGSAVSGEGKRAFSVARPVTEYSATIPSTGTYLLRISSIAAQDYRFSFELDGVAPDPLFLPT